MIGLVLVSHSEKLAEGARDLALQMTQGRVPIAIAGGIDDPKQPIGTDPIRVMSAISEVYTDAGVVVLMDLGSALMSAETALDLLDPAWRSQIHLCAAPFVEGAVTAAVQASIGAPAEKVLSAARGALRAKQAHLSEMGEAATAAPSSAAPVSADALRMTFVIPNKLGIHARPAARIVALAGQFDARLTLRREGQSADGRDINAVMLLDARQGDAIDALIEGVQGGALLQALRQLVSSNLGDDDSAVPAPSAAAEPVPDGVLQGVAAARGIAIAPVRRLEAQRNPSARLRTGPAADEHSRLRSAIQTVYDALRREGQTSGTAAERDIFDAHRLIVTDEDLARYARQNIDDHEQTAEAGWWSAIEALADRYRGSQNALLRARAADVLDVGRRVLEQLAPETARSLVFDRPCILAAPDLAPSETSQLNPDTVMAILTQQGGATSHTAIIARGMGIPAVTGLGAGYDALRDGQRVIVDGERGWVYPAPTVEQIATFEARAHEELAARQHLLATARAAARTRDGRRIEVAANIGGVQDAARLLEQGAEGVGLFRTELLFMGRSSAPGEEEQYAAYCAVAEALAGRPLIIRTLDVGGDKAIPYINIPPEDNPFLGYRGIRYWLGDRALARAQLRAILRAAATHNIKVMFPMVSTSDEVAQIHDFVRQTSASLSADSIAHQAGIDVGIMIEVPSAVLCAEALAQAVDFFSIGTNDLTQYLMAADRGNARVTPLTSPFQPAVLAAIRQVIDAAHAHGKWVGICGEMAGNPLLTRVLVGLGVDKLSMSAPAIAEVKRIVSETDYAEALALAREVLGLATAAEVEAKLRAAR